MLPVVAGARATLRHVFAYALVLVPITLLPWALHLAGAVYGFAALALGLG